MAGWRHVPIAMHFVDGVEDHIYIGVSQ